MDAARRDWPSALVMLGLLLWVGALLLVRRHFSGDFDYFFLIKNLFLAAIPFVLGRLLRRVDEQGAGGLAVATLFACWLAFFPNAPYVVTDLQHLRTRPFIPLWYDLGLLVTAGGAGLACGYLSLLDIHAVLSRRLGVLPSWLAVVACLFLTGFGIYLGRELRWNTWDLVLRPGRLMTDVAEPIVNPLEHSRTWGMTIMCGVGLTMGYLLLHAMQAERSRG